MNIKAMINTVLSKTGYQISKADLQMNRREFDRDAIKEWGPSGKILELGAGTDMWLRDRYENVTTFDQLKLPGIDVVGDVHNLSRYFKEDEFDTVLCSEIFEHTKDPLRAIEEIKKVLKKGGVFIGSAPTTIELHGEEYGHYWNITPQGWEYILRDFQIVDMKLRGIRPYISHVAVKAILK